MLLSLAFLIARITLSFGMFADFAFCITCLSLELVSGFGPPSLTAITISFPILVKVLDIFDHRFNFLAFLNSNARPISIDLILKQIKMLLVVFLHFQLASFFFYLSFAFLTTFFFLKYLLRNILQSRLFLKPLQFLWK